MMLKKIVLVFIVWCSANIVLGNEVTFKVVNQYGAKVDGLSILINGVSKDLVPENNGTVKMEIPNSDSFSFIAKNYITKKYATKSLSNGISLELKKSFTWKDLINPMFYIIYGGLYMLAFIIFAETGLFAGFFLPGDSLLFVAGIYSSKLAHEFLKLFGLGNIQNQWLDLLVLITLISLAGIIGNMVGYWFGKKVGPAMFSWKDRFLYKKKYLIQAQDFYDKKGGSAIIVARFLPFLRTFAPIVAGIVQMPKGKFIYYSIVGCIAWVSSMVLIGHFLDKIFPTLKNHLELIIIGIVLITTLPVIIKMITGKKEE